MTPSVTVDRGPFEMVPHWLLDHPDVSAQAVRLYMLIRRHGDKTGLAFPGRKRLAEQLHASPSTVDRARSELVAVGAICERRRSSEDGDWTSNEYHVHWEPRDRCRYLSGEEGSPFYDETPTVRDETGLPPMANELRPTSNLDPITHTSGATTPRSEGQRVNTLTKIYTDAVPLSNFPAVSGVVRKAVRAGLWDDETIGEALARMGADGRSVTTDGLRYELTGFPGRQTNRQRALEAGVERTRRLAAAGHNNLWEVEA